MRSSADNTAHHSPLRQMHEHPITAPPAPRIPADDGASDYAINLSLMNDISAPETILYDNYQPTSILGKLKDPQQKAAEAGPPKHALFSMIVLRLSVFLFLWCWSDK